MTLDVRVYRDTPKKGETDGKWCGYVVEPYGHIVRPGTTGHDSPEEVYRHFGVEPPAP